LSAAVRFLLGTTVSTFGDWLTTFALAVVIFDATGSVAATAGYMLVRVGPRPLGAWLGGPLGDLTSPRLAMVGVALTQSAVTAALAASLALGHRLWAVFVLVGLSQLVGGAWQPLTGALMARLASGGARHSINLAYILLGSGMMLISPAIGALLLPSLGPEPLVLGDTATFVIAAGLFLSLPVTGSGAARSLTVRAAAIGGFAATFRRPVLRVLATGAFSGTVVITAFQAALPALASQRFGTSADAGFCWAAVGLGGVLGSLLALWRPVRRPAVILPTLVGEIACIGAVAIAGGPAIDLLLLAGSTASGSLAQVEGGVIIQSQAPDMVGRIQGAVSTCRYLGMTGGATLALLLALTVTWQVLVLVLALGGLVLLGASALGPRATTPGAMATATATSPLGNIPD
jgi:MFS family permease